MGKVQGEVVIILQIIKSLGEKKTPDEVRLLDNNYALCFIRGERPIKDYKYDILKHPNIALTTDGGEKPYILGKTDKASASIIVLVKIREEK